MWGACNSFDLWAERGLSALFGLWQSRFLSFESQRMISSATTFGCLAGNLTALTVSLHLLLCFLLLLFFSCYFSLYYEIFLQYNNHVPIAILGAIRINANHCFSHCPFPVNGFLCLVESRTSNCCGSKSETERLTPNLLMIWDKLGVYFFEAGLIHGASNIPIAFLMTPLPLQKILCDLLYML